MKIPVCDWIMNSTDIYGFFEIKNLAKNNKNLEELVDI